MRANIPEKKIAQYNKVLRLVEANAPEADAARNILSHLESQYMGIKEAARIHRMTDEDSDDYEPSPQPGNYRHWSEVYEEDQRKKSSQSRWDKMKKAADGAFSWASQMASHVFGVQEAQMMAKDFVSITTRDNTSGSMTINVRFPEHIIDHAIWDFSPEQKTVFLNTLSARFFDELRDILDNTGD